jgi:DNA-directed RNA polymerase specialized sigma24 family protein
LSQQQIESPLGSSQEGDCEASQQLFASLYDELRRMAQRELRRAGPSLTLGATTLLHELYLSVHERPDALFPDRSRFFAYASRAMRGLIID